MNNKRKAVFLDRDGTINIEKNYLYKIEDFEYIPGVIDALRQLCSMGYALIIISNQSGIARGYYTENDYEHLDSWVKEDLRQKGIDITASYYCPHHPEAIIPKYRIKCECRKPGTKLFWDAQKEYDIDMNVSFAVGDRMRDLAICKESGVKGILFSDNNSIHNDTVDVCSSWYEIIKLVNKYEDLDRI